MEELCRGLRRVADSDDVYVAPGDEAGVLVRILINAHAEDDQVGLVVVELEEGR